MTDYINTDAYHHTPDEIDADEEYQREPYDWEQSGE